MPSGGGGMVSTAEDYYRFAQMLRNGGELDGMRILAPSTVKLMTSNHVPAELLTGKFGIGAQVMRPGFGYGYDCAVVFDPPEANLPDGKGTFFWDGAAGTWFWVDPTNDIVFIGMIQRMLGPASPNLEYLSRSAVYRLSSIRRNNLSALPEFSAALYGVTGCGAFFGVEIYPITWFLFTWFTTSSKSMLSLPV